MASCVAALMAVIACAPAATGGTHTPAPRSAANASRNAGAGAAQAIANLVDAEGHAVGTATFRTSGNGVAIVVVANGLKPGVHGIHIHTVGRCDPPAFTSAGGHFNPGGMKHGLNAPGGPHAGDLPNFVVPASGQARYTGTTTRVTLGSGPTSLFDADGSALVIHAGPDDNVTDPAGNSGARIACGVIVRSTP